MQRQRVLFSRRARGRTRPYLFFKMCLKTFFVQLFIAFGPPIIVICVYNIQKTSGIASVLILAIIADVPYNITWLNIDVPYQYPEQHPTCLSKWVSRRFSVPLSSRLVLRSFFSRSQYSEDLRTCWCFYQGEQRQSISVIASLHSILVPFSGCFRSYSRAVCGELLR